MTRPEKSSLVLALIARGNVRLSNNKTKIEILNTLFDNYVHPFIVFFGSPRLLHWILFLEAPGFSLAKYCASCNIFALRNPSECCWWSPVAQSPRLTSFRPKTRQRAAFSQTAPYRVKISVSGIRPILTGFHFG